jgi:hypothetical protein
VQRSLVPVDNQRILRRRADGSQHIISHNTTVSAAPEAAHGTREAVGTRAQPHAERLAAAAATQLAKPTAQKTGKCGALTKELLQKYAVSNTVMITVNDIITVQSLGRHWLRNVDAANITNWLMVATDTATAAYLESLGVSRCFMLLGTEGRAKADTGYRWHDLPWIAATWRNTEAAAKVGDEHQLEHVAAAGPGGLFKLLSEEQLHLGMHVTSLLSSLSMRSWHMHRALRSLHPILTGISWPDVVKRERLLLLLACCCWTGCWHSSTCTS